MKAFIIGAGGFVGNHLIRHLEQQNFTVYKSYLDFEYAALADKTNSFSMDIYNATQVADVLMQIKPDYIYHLAAQSSVGVSWQKPQLTFGVNCIGFINVLEAIRIQNLRTRVLAIGSSEEYGTVREEDNPISETLSAHPANPYAISKHSQALFADLYCKAHGLDIITVRAFNHIGPGQTEQFVLSDFCKRVVMIEHGDTEPVLYVGNLAAKRDFTDVRDIVRAYSLLMEKGVTNRLYNVGSGKAYLLRDLLDKILDMVSIKVDVVIDESKLRPIDIPIMQCNNARLFEDTGWQPQIDIAITIEDTLNYWRRQIGGEVK